MDDLPATIGEKTKDLFEFAFSILPSLGLRDENYRRLYDHLSSKVCAFCGIEILDAPSQKREALDHYLPIADYPFAGTNFRNLSPMGSKCNSRYKGRQNIIVEKPGGNRRKCSDPYSSPPIELSLLRSRPFEGESKGFGACPVWEIDWVGGDPEKLKTWDNVFSIKERYKESSLNQNFSSWMKQFARWAARERHECVLEGNVRQILRDFGEIVVEEGYSDSAFLKRAVIQMLEYKCDQTEQGKRLVEWLTGLIKDYLV